uniref:Reverse transcriptase domain-containing protein n=1 Tax=Cannabis sativa TaxID=3483 RepID=A0A803P2R9_CANSA
MLFADDSYLYCKAISVQALKIQELLRKFELASHQKEKVRKYLQGWDGKFLSKAEKEVLLKVIAQSLPSYAMNIFILPLKITRDIKGVRWCVGNGQDINILDKSWFPVKENPYVSSTSWFVKF